MLRYSSLLLLFLSTALFAATNAPKLLQPVQCTLNKDCYIQLYVDTGNKDQLIDFKGHYLTNNNHTGTDIALKTYEDMDQGVNVVAASNGIVLAVRNDQQDHYSRDYEFEQGKACGNGVLIIHPGNWTTQYCHLKKGSIRVKPKQQVMQGDILGLVGSSGHADFPHTHFTVRYFGKVVDPFLSKLWQDDLHYQGYGMIDYGMTNHAVSVHDVINHGLRQTEFTNQDEKMLAWSRVYGVEKGGIGRVSFIDPNQQLFGKPTSVRVNDHFKEWG